MSDHDDLATMTRDELVAEIIRLRENIARADELYQAAADTLRKGGESS